MPAFSAAPEKHSEDNKQYESQHANGDRRPVYGDDFSGIRCRRFVKGFVIHGSHSTTPRTKKLAATADYRNATASPVRRQGASWRLADERQSQVNHETFLHTEAYFCTHNKKDAAKSNASAAGSGTE